MGLLIGSINAVLSRSSWLWAETKSAFYNRTLHVNRLTAFQRDKVVKQAPTLNPTIVADQSTPGETKLQTHAYSWMGFAGLIDFITCRDNDLWSLLVRLVWYAFLNPTAVSRFPAGSHFCLRVWFIIGNTKKKFQNLPGRENPLRDIAKI